MGVTFPSTFIFFITAYNCHPYLHLFACEFLVTKVADDEPFGASEAEMILHADSRDAGGALRGTLDRIPLANVEMRL